MEEKIKRYEKPTVEELDEVDQGRRNRRHCVNGSAAVGNCTTGSVAGTVCNTGIGAAAECIVGNAGL